MAGVWCVGDVAAVMRFHSCQTLAVTGGAGRYQPARGQAGIVDNGDDTEQIMVRLNRR